MSARGAIKGPLWTEEEDARLRALAASGWESASNAELLEAFPGRTLHAIRNRATRFKPNRRRRPDAWTREEELFLRGAWPATSERTLRERLGRQWAAIVHHARKLGIMGLRWQGFESPTAAAVRSGFERRALKRILAAWVVHYYSLPGDARAELPNPEPRAKRWHHGPVARRKIPKQIEAGAVDCAVAWWMGLETRSEAMARLGLHRLPEGHARRLGLRKGDRHTPEEWDRLLLALRRRPGPVAGRASRKVAA